MFYQVLIYAPISGQIGPDRAENSNAPTCKESYPIASSCTERMASPASGNSETGTRYARLCVPEVRSGIRLRTGSGSKSNTPILFAQEVFFRGANSLKTLEVLRAFLLRIHPREKEKEKENGK